jgi:serralysin
MENSSLVTELNATDADGDELLFSLVEVDDHESFSIGSTSGMLSFKATPDFEDPVDENLDNIYSVSILVSDGELSAEQELEITVLDVNETIKPVNRAPEFLPDSGGFTVYENSALVTELNATDADGDELLFSLVEVDDHESFSIGRASGVLGFKAVPDFENPVDGNLDNIYIVNVLVSDGELNDQIALEIQVLDENETIEPENRSPDFTSILTNYTVVENSTFVADINATDPDGDDLIFSLLEEDDYRSFSIGSTSGMLSFNVPPDFEYPTDQGTNNSYNVTLSVSDGNATNQVDVTVTVLDLDESAQTVEEAQILVNGYFLGNHWREAGWFGTYYSKFFPWVYHSSMGWLYIVQSKDGDTWMWKDMMEWVWTDLDVFPHFFIQSSQQWGYMGSGSQSGQYYLFESGNSGWVDF